MVTNGLRSFIVCMLLIVAGNLTSMRQRSGCMCTNVAAKRLSFCTLACLPVSQPACLMMMLALCCTVCLHACVTLPNSGRAILASLRLQLSCAECSRWRQTADASLIELHQCVGEEVGGPTRSVCFSHASNIYTHTNRAKLLF